jgi:hypothetical protein
LIILFLTLSAPRTDPDPVLVDLPGVRLPAALPADQAPLRDEAPVVGVEVGGQCRAYALAAFAPAGRGYGRHVVNDLIGTTPITVTFCDRTECARVFIGPEGGTPLDIGVGGWTGDGERGAMLLKVGDARYYQATGRPLGGGENIPYAEAQFLWTTWGQWREAHPDTAVYVGDPPYRPQGGAPGS